MEEMANVLNNESQTLYEKDPISEGSTNSALTNQYLRKGESYSKEE
jgi:hypothetical protein